MTSVKNKGLRLVVAGASGVIGRAVMRSAQQAGLAAVGTGRSRTPGALKPFDMATQKLGDVVDNLDSRDVVILLAGYISPAWIFEHADEACRVNLDASRRIADEVFETGARLIFMSTDQVFDGVAGGYVEAAPTAPMNLYGRLKATMERHVLAAPGQGFVARTGWNVAWEPGTHCAVAQCYQAMLQPGARMAGDNVVSVCDVEDTARGLVAMAVSPPPSAIYHLVSAPGVVRSDLAAAVKRESRYGSAMAYRVVPFSEIAYSEPRPTRAFLRAERLGEIGVEFADPWSVIARKVRLLDTWCEEAGTPAAEGAPR